VNPALEALAMVAAGVGGGIVGSVAGLASLVSYPALLALGLPPLAANVTNTVALVLSSVGSTLGSRPELAGQGPRLRRQLPAAVLGGAAGAVLLLVTPAGAFAAVVPWLVGGASAVLLLQPRLRRARPHAVPGGGRSVLAGVFAICVYGGYFGAAAGVLMLALLMTGLAESLVRANAVKNVVLGAANAVAAVGFAVAGPVDWPVALPLAAGFLAGGWVGPRVARALPAGPLRVLIALAGLALAVHLALSGG
jgi:uncharacterized protein